MTLEATNKAGYWEDTAWDGTSPATFAVLIGVSKYRHLEHGEAEAAASEPWIREASALGQLFVSAMTARRMLDWLASDYRMATAPLARCWLLTSPTDEELAEMPELGLNVLEPTLDHCRDAIQEWAAAPSQLPAQSQSLSRSLFFFSGHGIESTTMNQLLLPSDYLKGPMVSFNHAISTRNIRMGMNSVPVGHRFYFLDACRNDTDKIRQKGPEGTEILPEQPSSMTFGQIELDAALSATAATSKAWQPRKPEDGETLFGQALVAGLQGTPSIDVTQDAGQDTIRFGSLYKYVNDKVPELIRNFGSNATQKVKPSMEHGIDGIITELDPQVAERSSAAMLPKSVATEQPEQEFITEALDEPRLQAAGWAEDFNIGHKLFGHESVTALFSNSLRVAALSRGQWLPRDAIRVMSVDRREIDTGETGLLATYRLRLVIDDDEPRGHWLELRNFGAEGGGGIVLPADPSRASAFEVDVVISLSSEGGVIQSLDALPWQTDEDSPVARAAALWRKYQQADLEGAVRNMEDGTELRTLVQYKMESPLAATIAAAVLLRANRLDLLSDWVRNIANWFPHLPDGPVLWAEQLWRQTGGQPEAMKAIAESLLEGTKRGLPMTSEAMGYAHLLYHRLSRETETLPKELLGPLDKGEAALDLALRFLRPGGLFCAYFGFGPNSRPMSIQERAEHDANAPQPAEPLDIDYAPDGVFIDSIFLPFGE